MQRTLGLVWLLCVITTGLFNNNVLAGVLPEPVNEHVYQNNFDVRSDFPFLPALVRWLFEGRKALYPPAQNRVLIDIGGTSDYGGTPTISPNLNGYTWNNMTDARPGVQVTNAVTIANQPSGLSVEVINRVDGTYNISSLGMGSGNTAGAVGDYPASATTDHALIHSSATNGKWKISGLLSNKTYNIKFWGTRSTTTASRSAEIKRADDSVWKSYNATGNTDYNNAAVFTITGKTSMDFDIRTKAGSDFSAINVLDISYGSDSAITLPQVINLPPVALAGANATIQLPLDSALLNGCSAYDPEQAPLRYKWTKISGPAIPVFADTSCTAKIRSLTAGTYLFELMVTDTGNIAAKDTMQLTVNPVVINVWPSQVTPLCNRPYRIVVVGSSTAYGTGSNPIDSSWVRKFRDYLLVQNPGISVINIATPGLTSYDVLPTGSVVPAPFTVDTVRNITKALTYNPDAIILNLPSNDVARGIPTNTIHNNFLTITGMATARNIPVWVTTSQPRNGLSPAETLLQMDLRDWINNTYGSKAVDFWSTVSNADGTINEFYSAGDGVHLNNYGHHVLFTRIVSEKIWDTLCLRANPAINQVPVARAGNDTIITANTLSLRLDGTRSYDPEGAALQYSWRIIQTQGGTLSDANTSHPLFVTNATGSSSIELTVTDAAGLAGRDTMLIRLNAVPHIAPVANAGSDKTIRLPVNKILLDGRGSSDSDGAIILYKWVYVSGPSGYILLNPSKDTSTVTFSTPGVYIFKLNITDNDGLSSSDNIAVTVLQVTLPASNDKSINVSIYGGTNAYANPAWNNWNLANSAAFNNFSYNDGTVSTVSASITAAGIIADNGANYAMSATACPGEVLRYNSANTSIRSLIFSGLNMNKTYTLKFFASRANTGNSTVFLVKGVHDTISTSNNINDFALFERVSPETGGKLNVDITRIGIWNYLAGFTIIENTGTGRQAQPQTGAPKTMQPASDQPDKRFFIRPNPVSSDLYINIPASIEGRYDIMLLDIYGNIMKQQKGRHIKGSSSVHVDVKDLPKGLYIIKVSGQQKTVNTTVIKL